MTGDSRAQPPVAEPVDGELDTFRRRVLADPRLQARLDGYLASDDHAAAAAALGDEIGAPIATATVAAATRRDPLNIGRWGDAPVVLDRWPIEGWLPTHSVQMGGALAFDWARFGTRPLVEPFYEDSTRRATALPFNLMFRTRTTLDALVADADAHPALSPSGFVFHMSRCGSTLVSGMLAAVAHHHVVSEADPLDAVVQWAATSDAPLSARIAALRAIVTALGRHRTNEARRFFVKLDSWHTLALPLFRAAFPDVPWLFLYRDPVEVMVSQVRQPGVHAVAGCLPPDVLAIADATDLSFEEHCAQVLTRICGAALAYEHLGGGLLLDYRDLRAAMADRIPAHFGFVPDAQEAAAMRQATTDHSKYPGTSFVTDGTTKRATSSPAIEAAVAAHLRPLYERLEQRREHAASA